MGTGSFAEKFEAVIQERRKADPKWGLRTLARELAKDDPRQTEIIRRRLNKYRPKPGGGAAEVAPTEPTRREIERALGLPVDALEADEDLLAAMQPLRLEALFNTAILDEFLLERAQVALHRASRDSERATKKASA